MVIIAPGSYSFRIDGYHPMNNTLVPVQEGRIAQTVVALLSLRVVCLVMATLVGGAGLVLQEMTLIAQLAPGRISDVYCEPIVSVFISIQKGEKCQLSLPIRNFQIKVMIH